MEITRRSFIKGTAVLGASAVAGHFLYGRLDTLRVVEGAEIQKEQWIPTVCWIGKQDCGVLARTVNGMVVKLEGNPDNPRNRGTLCPKGMGQIFAMYDPNRVHSPLVRTNEKGKPGKWKVVSWDEALDLVAQKVKEAREKAKQIGKDKKDNPFLVWHKGRSKAKAFYDDALVNATGATKLHHGAYCSDAGYRACEYTLGMHGVLNPDFRYNKYLLSWGWNITNAGGNRLCWITWPQQLLEAKQKGLKVVHIDPRLRSAGPHADKWVPIRPGTDLALALAICHELIKIGKIDREYLTKYTNAPFLVDSEGRFVRSSDRKETVWDVKSKSPQPHQKEKLEPALEGTFKIDGKDVKTAFTLFQDHVNSYTPEWASSVCDIPASTIREIAKELGENAMIGSTIVVDGITLPYRPVGIMAYHMTQQEHGFQALRAMLMISMLLGSVGAVGGQLVDSTWKIDEKYLKLDKTKLTDHPNIYLKDSKFYPINSNCTGVVAKVMQDPKKYGVEYLPEVVILHMLNAVVAFPSQKDITEAFNKFKFVAAIDPWLSETADHYADVVLPASTMEKYEGPIKVDDGYEEALTMRIPVMPPLYKSRGEIDIYLDLCKRVGILYGPGGYLDQLNTSLKLKEADKLSLTEDITTEKILDRAAKSAGVTEGIEYFKKNGIYKIGAIKTEKRYGYALKPVFGSIKDGDVEVRVIHRFYGESLLRLQGEMKAALKTEKDEGKIYWQDYTPFPTWRNPTMEISPKEYDMYLISYKMIEYKQSRSSFIPLLAELAPQQHVYMNAQTAKAKKIGDQDMAYIESHNALTGETRRVKVKICHSEAVRPDTVAFPHHYGHWTHPWTKGQGPTVNQLFFTGEGYVTNTADQSFHVKVKVEKA